jgi:hypothetical protein
MPRNSPGTTFGCGIVDSALGAPADTGSWLSSATQAVEDDALVIRGNATTLGGGAGMQVSPIARQRE